MTEVTGGGGIRLHAQAFGPVGAPSALLLHGWAQSHLCWEAQTGGDLARDHRLVALDLRGHGASEKPEAAEAYADGALWAEDIRATIEAFALDRPVLVGWSYAGRVIGEYLAVHGDKDIGGILLLGALPASGAGREAWMMGPESAAKIPGLGSDDDAKRRAATRAFVSACTATPLYADLFERAVAWNMACPAHARRGCGGATADTRTAYARVRVPVTILHGAEDRVVTSATAEDLARLMPHARLEILDGIGHMPFLEAPERVEAALRAMARVAA